MAGSVGDGEFGFQIAPMLDILFVLLLFFMVNAGAQKHETSLITELPGNGAPGALVPIAIGIDGDGQVNIATVPVDSPTDHSLPTVLDKLRGAVAANPDQAVVITPARTTRHQRIVDVLNTC